MSQHHNIFPTHAAKVAPDCVVGEGTSIGERCTIKKSVLGKGCSIGDGVRPASWRSAWLIFLPFVPQVKIFNSVILDRVVLGNNCVVQVCVSHHHC